MARPGAKLAGPVTKLAVLVICAGLTMLSWWHPFKLSGFGWVIPALIGPFMVVLMLCALLFPDRDDKLVVEQPLAPKSSPGKRETRLEQLAVATGVIHGGVWMYVNWR